MAKYRYVAGFWLSVALAAWSLYGLGHGLEVLANNPHKYVNDVMMPALLLLTVLAAVFVRLALRFRRRMGGLVRP